MQSQTASAASVEATACSLQCSLYIDCRHHAAITVTQSVCITVVAVTHLGYSLACSLSVTDCSTLCSACTLCGTCCAWLLLCDEQIDAVYAESEDDLLALDQVTAKLTKWSAAMLQSLPLFIQHQVPTNTTTALHMISVMKSTVTVTAAAAAAAASASVVSRARLTVLTTVAQCGVLYSCLQRQTI
jgi:hypothetical protein